MTQGIDHKLCHCLYICTRDTCFVSTLHSVLALCIRLMVPSTNGLSWCTCKCMMYKRLTCALEWLYVCVCLTFCHWLQAGCDWNNYSGVTYLLYLNSEVFSEMFDTLTSAWKRTQIWMALLKYLIWYWFKWPTKKIVLFYLVLCFVY